MDILTRLMSDTVWFVSTTAHSLDVTVIVVCIVSLSICAGLAAFLFSFFKEESFEDGLKASRAQIDKEAKRKQQEEKEAAKQRANELKKARKASKKAAGQLAPGDGKDHFSSESGIAKEQSQVTNDKNILQTKKDSVNNKKKKRRRLKGTNSHPLDDVTEAPSTLETENTGYGSVQEEDNGREEVTLEVDEQNEQTVPEIELEEEIYHDGVEQGHGQMPGSHPAALKNGPGVVDENEFEYEEDSSATATPEPGTKKQGNPINSNQGSKKHQDANLGANHVIAEREEKSKPKKMGKIAIEEVDYVSPIESKAAIPTMSTSNDTEQVQAPVDLASTQEHVYQKSDAPPNFVDGHSLNIQQNELQQASPRKNKKKGGSQIQKVPNQTGSKGIMVSSAHELVTAVKSIHLEAAETQTMIDILLNRQLEFGGISSTHNGWVEPGNQKSKIDQLERDLGNRNSELNDEQGKVKSLTERLQHVRKELNEERSNHINARRAVDELQARHNQKAQALEARLQQEIDQRHRDAAHFQGQIQYHIQHTQQLQANLESAAATAAESQQRLAQQPGPSALYPELEQLRQYKIQSDTETSNLRNQLSLKQNEINTLQTNLNESSSRAGEVEGAKVELQKAKENAKSLQDKCDRLEKKFAENDNQRKSESDKTTELDRKLEELKLSNTALEAKIIEHEKSLQSKSKEINNLTEDNARLSMEMTSATKENGVANGVHNGDGKEHDLTNQKSELLVKEMKQEIEQYKDQLKTANSELNAQRSKNDDLRSKNWKAMEALNSVEQSYQKLLKAPAKSQQQSSLAKSDTSLSVSELKVKENITKIQKEAEQAQKSFLMRLFEDVVDVNDSSLKNKDHEKWLHTFSEKVNMWKKKQSAFKPSNSKEMNGNDDSKEQLIAQVEHYKGVLGETERMLHQLQSTVETEESRWKSRLGEKEAELEQVRKETQKLSQNNIALEESLKVVNSAEEMEEKLQQLQKKLGDEESERKEMTILMSQMNEKQKEEKEKVSKEMAVLKNNFDSEKRCRADLESKVVQMNQIISTAQEALQQEQKTVELLRQQIPKSDKASESTSFISVNGNVEQNEQSRSGNKTPQSQSTGSRSVSQAGSVASSLDISLEGQALNQQQNATKDKKSKKKKLLGLIKISK